MSSTDRRGAAAHAQAAVLLGDRRIGTLHYQGGRSWFRYEDLDPDHPVLGLRFEDNPGYGGHRLTGVPVWFANLLPERESGLRRLYNSRLGVRESHDFHLLIHVGEDLPGAVRVRPEGALPSDLSPQAAAAMGRPGKLSFSLSGMQLKFSMSEVGRDEGFVLPEAGEDGDWIVKLPSQVHRSLPANEYAVMTWASLAGMDVPEHRLVRAERLAGLPEEIVDPDEYVFAIRRFDRVYGGRVHQEDFAQILDAQPFHKDRGSQELVGGVLAANCPPEDLDEYVRRLVFCVAAGNTDEHLKNWSVRYPDGRTPRLSPAYDLVGVTAYPAFRRDGLTLPLSGQADTRRLRRDHFRRFAGDIGIDEDRAADIVAETVDRLHATWQQVVAETPVPEFVTGHLEERLTSLPLLRGE
jgi:serine/threonine-protein kinase HipA